jgi:hypothetical protein
MTRDLWRALSLKLPKSWIRAGAALIGLIMAALWWTGPSEPAKARHAPPPPIIPELVVQPIPDLHRSEPVWEPEEAKPLRPRERRRLALVDRVTKAQLPATTQPMAQPHAPIPPQRELRLVRPLGDEESFGAPLVFANNVAARQPERRFPKRVLPASSEAPLELASKPIANPTDAPVTNPGPNTPLPKHVPSTPTANTGPKTPLPEHVPSTPTANPGPKTPLPERVPSTPTANPGPKTPLPKHVGQPTEHATPQTDHGNQSNTPPGVGPPQKPDFTIPPIAFLPVEAPGKFATDWIGRSSSAAEPGGTSRAAPVPEPGTFALLGLGLATLIAVRRRR